MPDPPGCLFEHREILEEIRVFHLLDPTMGCKRSHLEARAVGFQVLQVGDRGDVHEGGGANESEVHHGDQALAAGQQFGVVTQLGELLDALFHSVRSLVLEGSRFQPSSSPFPKSASPRGLYTPPARPILCLRPWLQCLSSVPYRWGAGQFTQGGACEMRTS